MVFFLILFIFPASTIANEAKNTHFADELFKRGYYDYAIIEYLRAVNDFDAGWSTILLNYLSGLQNVTYIQKDI